MSKQGLASRLAWVGGAAAMVLAFAPGSAGASCSVKVDDPTVHRTRTGDRIIVGAGTRGSDCKEKKIFIRPLAPSPDAVVRRDCWHEVHFTVTNGTLRVKYAAGAQA